MLQRKLFSNKISRRSAPSPLSFSSHNNTIHDHDRELTVTPWAEKSEEKLFKFENHGDRKWLQEKAPNEGKWLFKIKNTDRLGFPPQVTKIVWVVASDHVSFEFKFKNKNGDELADGIAIPIKVERELIQYSITLRNIGGAPVTIEIQNVWGNNFEAWVASTLSAGIFYIAKQYDSKVGKIFRNYDGSASPIDKPESVSNESE